MWYLLTKMKKKDVNFKYQVNLYWKSRIIFFQTFSYRSDNEGASTSESDNRSRSPTNRKNDDDDDDGKIEFITEFGATTTENISTSSSSSSKQPGDSRSVYYFIYHLISYLIIYLISSTSGFAVFHIPYRENPFAIGNFISSAGASQPKNFVTFPRKKFPDVASS